MGNDAQAERVSVALDELHGLLGKVRSERRVLNDRPQYWTWWQNVMWRWLLPFHAGVHHGKIEMLESLERDLLYEILMRGQHLTEDGK